MCCRYVLVQEHTRSLLEKVAALLEPGTASPPPSRYNLAPGAPIFCIRNTPAAPRRRPAPVDPKADVSREPTWLHWGMIPSWARDDDSPLVNARAESLADKPSFRDAFRARRCLVPASGFYEWKAAGRSRQPWLFRLRDERPFFLAGLWDRWRTPGGSVLESCAIVTTTPNELMAPIHHRMPVLLAEPAAWETWLDPRMASVDTLYPLLRPLPSDAMTAVAVNPRVNDIRHDAPDCLEPASPSGLPPDEPQLPLGF